MSTPISSTTSSTDPVSASLDTARQLKDQVAATLLNQQSGPPVTFSGLVAGINTPQIIQALMRVEKAPVLQLQAQQADEQARLAAWQEINGKLNSIQAAASTLGLQGTVGAKQLSFAGPSGTFATGTAKSSAATGSFQLQIDQLATATTVTSQGGVGVAITGTDIATSSSKLATPVTKGTFT